MIGGSPHRNAAAELEGELNLLDFKLTRLGLPETTFQRPAPRRLTTTGRLTSSWNSEVLRVLEALVSHIDTRIRNNPSDADVSAIEARVREIDARLVRERARQRPIYLGAG